MEKLKFRLKLSGVGESMYATQIKRTDNVCMYLRDDGYYEVGIIKQQKANTMFGKDYPDRELYFSNEDFGTIAKCVRTRKKADEYFDMFENRVNNARRTVLV